MVEKNNHTWKKYLTPAIIVMIVMALVGFIANSFSEELKEKADNKTLQMYIIQQEKQKDLEQKSIDDRFKMQQKNTEQQQEQQQKSMEQLINILKDK